MINSTEILGNKSRNTVIKLASNAIDKHVALKDFLHYANETGQQSNSLVHFHTQRNAINSANTFYSSEISNGLSKISDTIDDVVKSCPDVKREADCFISEFAQKYPKTAKLRSYYAKHGYVVSDKVKPIPLYRHILRKGYSSVCKLINNIKESELYKILTDTNPNHSEALK